ncbi:MAG: hypothetical protein GF331_16210 [Chitinivibrionales bacterium]|nr:hypothetical protein [Chitinivibrionales bacterium]
MSTGPTLETCKRCGAHCCRHVAMHIDTPTCKRDYDNIRWFLMHENVNILVDHENDWLVEFITPCANLKSDNTCGRYEQRPRVCRTYPAPDEECEFTGTGKSHRLRFASSEQFERYLTRKKIKWRWKK